MIYIMLASYNGEKYISEQIESLLSQTYQDWKLWIHDDNSKDNTVEIIRHYGKQNPQKIFFIDDDFSSGGAKENFTYLLNNIDDNFDYIMFCDQDDVWIKNRVELFVNRMEIEEQKNQELPLVIFSDLTVVDDRLNVISQSMVKFQKLNPNIANSFSLLKCQNVITGCAMMLNKKALEKSLPIPSEAMMHDWWIGLITAKYGKNIFLDERTILYRQHGGNAVGAKNITLTKIIKVIFSKKLFTDYIGIRNMIAYADDENFSFKSFCICKIKCTFLRFIKLLDYKYV